MLYHYQPPQSTRVVRLEAHDQLSNQDSAPQSTPSPRRSLPRKGEESKSGPGACASNCLGLETGHTASSGSRFQIKQTIVDNALDIQQASTDVGMTSFATKPALEPQSAACLGERTPPSPLSDTPPFSPRGAPRKWNLKSVFRR